MRFPHGVEQAALRLRLSVLYPFRRNPEAPHERIGIVDVTHAYSNLWVELVRSVAGDTTSEWPHWAGRAIAWSQGVIMLAIIALIAFTVASLASVPANALGGAFDVSSPQVPGGMQQFNGYQEGTSATLQFPVVYTNNGGNYSPATFKYTVPAAGVYIFTADVSFAMAQFGSGENQCELALNFIVENPDGSAVARFVASDIIMTPPGSFLPGGYDAMHTAGTMIRRMPLGSLVSARLSVGPNCVGEVHPFQGAHFSGGKL